MWFGNNWSIKPITHHQPAPVVGTTLEFQQDTTEQMCREKDDVWKVGCSMSRLVDVVAYGRVPYSHWEKCRTSQSSPHHPAALTFASSTDPASDWKKTWVMLIMASEIGVQLGEFEISMDFLWLNRFESSQMLTNVTANIWTWISWSSLKFLEIGDNFSPRSLDFLLRLRFPTEVILLCSHVFPYHSQAIWRYPSNAYSKNGCKLV